MAITISSYDLRRRNRRDLNRRKNVRCGRAPFYLLPGLEQKGTKIDLSEQNGIYLDTYRFPTLEFLVGMAARVNLAPTL